MRILIVDDETNIRKSLRIALESMKNTVEEAMSLSDASKRIEDAAFDAAFVDLRLKDDLGLDLLEALTKVSPGLAVVIITAYASIDNAVEAMRRGAFDYLSKPFTPAQIRAVLERFERVRVSQSQIADLQEQIGVDVPEFSLDSRDPEVRTVLEQGRQVAPTDAVVLIRGESGTGKGVFGTRAIMPISEMDTRLQAKLLRALQEREIDRLGGASAVKVNVRILATTNRDLPVEVARGIFREDLYFRLNVVSLRVPPLRERPGDVVALAEFFARRYAEVNDLPYRALSRAALVRLAAHSWRGNVRELENTIHRAVLLAEGDELDAASIELGPQGSLPGGSLPGGSFPGGAPSGPTERAGLAAPESHPAAIAGLVGRRMDDVERDLIIGTLGHTLGNRTHAATILGISIRALRNKLRDYATQGVRVPPPAAGVAA